MTGTLPRITLPGTSAWVCRCDAIEAYGRALAGRESLAVAYDLAEQAMTAGASASEMTTAFTLVRATKYGEDAI